MNERTLRPGNIAAAAVVIGGVLVIALPQHGVSIVRLVIVTVAAAAGLYALALNAPATWWASPFDRNVRLRRNGQASDELDWIRSTLSGRRQRIESGPALPPETLRLLQPLIDVALERQGLDPHEPAHADSARGLLSAHTWAVSKAEPLKWPPRRRTLRPDKRNTTEVVHSVLDELERLTASAAGVAEPLGGTTVGVAEGAPPDTPRRASGRRDPPSQRHSETSRHRSP